MRLAELDYDLPQELIAQAPLADRAASRLLVVERATGQISHQAFRALPALLRPSDVLVLNNSRVLAARLHGTKAETGGAVELLLLRATAPDEWLALLKPGRRLRVGSRVDLGSDHAVLRSRHGAGLWTVAFEPAGAADRLMRSAGQMPLPPYIHERLLDAERYQTIFAREPGSAAAPTAGLHFTPDVFAALDQRGIATAEVTLHVGLDTFRPVQTEIVEDHPIHREHWTVEPGTAARLRAAAQNGQRLVAVGTTSVRTLETLAATDFAQVAGETDLFITPGYQFAAVGAMVTNFHLPRTTLFALVCAFAGADLIRQAYAAAISERYRLLSFGDAMLIL